MEFPGKFQKKTLEFWNSLGNSKIPKFFGRCFGIQEKILEFWNFLGNSKKTLEFWNSLGNSKKNFGILEFPRKFQKKNFGILEFWNLRGNSKIPKFFPEFQNIFQKTLEFWNFGIFEEIPKFQSFFLEFSRKFQNSKIFTWIPKHLPKNFGIWEFWNFSRKVFSVWTSYLSFLSSDYGPPLLLP